MALFDQSNDEPANYFPTEPAFVVPVEVRSTPHYGPGHQGVFALQRIKAGTKFWVWTDRVEKIHHIILDQYIADHFGENIEQIRCFLRQGFVLPGDNDTFFCSNPTDAGRFMNHSSSPNCGPDGALRDVEEGEELTMDYSFHGNPLWYQDVCRKFGVQTEAEIANLFS